MGRLSCVFAGAAIGSAVTYWLVSSKFSTKKTSDNSFDGEGTEDTTSRSRSLSRGAQPRSNRSASAIAHLDRDGLITDLLKELWPYINVAGSNMIRESVEPSFVDLPGPLSSLHFTKVDLGDVPIRMDNITVHEIENGKLKISMDLVWDGTCDMCLKADYIGSFGVKSIKLFGRLSFLLKPLENVIPPFAAIQFSFVAPPKIELDFTGLAQVADFAVIDQKIRAIIQDSFASVVLPNRMLTKMDMAVNFLDTYEPPIGIARVTLVRGRGFVEEVRSLRANDVPDVYCNVSMNSTRTWKTAVVKDSLSPVWKDETADFVLSDYDQTLTIHAWDEDKGALDSDDDLGVTQVSFGDILLAGKTLEVELQQDGVGTGAFVTVHCDILSFSSSLTSFESILPNPVNPNILHGMITVVVTNGKELPLKEKDAASFVKVKYGESFEQLSAVVTEYPGIDPLNPEYDMVCFVPLFAPLAAETNDVIIELWNAATKMGNITVSHKSLVDTKDHVITGFQEVQGAGGCQLEFRVSLHGVASTVSPTGKQPLTSAIESPTPQPLQALHHVKVTIAKGWGFPVQKRRFKKDDIPDVYCKIQFGSSPSVWRTTTIRNSVNPIWNQSHTYKFQDGQILNINVYDEDKGDKDDFLGSTRIAVGKILLAGGEMDVELLDTGKPTGFYVRLTCQLLE